MEEHKILSRKYIRSGRMKSLTCSIFIGIYIICASWNLTPTAMGLAVPHEISTLYHYSSAGPENQSGSFPAAISEDSDLDYAEQKIIQLAKDSNQCMRYLYRLTKEIGPRPSVSENLLIACNWAKEQFNAFGLENVHLEDAGVVYDSKLAHLLNISPKSIYNVVADIPGRDLKDEYVIIGAHLDSHKLGEGAQDDGAGVSATLEAARILSKANIKPRRTIRFILFSGEEVGKLGSKAYVKNHPEIVQNTSAMFNMDYGSNFISGIYATKYQKDDFVTVFEPIQNLDENKQFELKIVESLDIYYQTCCGSGGTSDHGSFLDAGIPAFFWLQDGDENVTYYAHTVRDTYDKVNPEYIKYSTAIIALTAYRVANLDDRLSRMNLVNKKKAGGSKCSSTCGK
jgi:hypothetical protein